MQHFQGSLSQDTERPPNTCCNVLSSHLGKRNYFLFLLIYCKYFISNQVILVINVNSFCLGCQQCVLPKDIRALTAKFYSPRISTFNCKRNLADEMKDHEMKVSPRINWVRSTEA